MNSVLKFLAVVLLGLNTAANVFNYSANVVLRTQSIQQFNGLILELDAVFSEVFEQLDQGAVQVEVLTARVNAVDGTEEKSVVVDPVPVAKPAPKPTVPAIHPTAQ